MAVYTALHPCAMAVLVLVAAAAGAAAARSTTPLLRLHGSGEPGPTAARDSYLLRADGLPAWAEAGPALGVTLRPHLTAVLDLREEEDSHDKPSTTLLRSLPTALRVIVRRSPTPAGAPLPIDRAGTTSWSGNVSVAAGSAGAVGVRCGVQLLPATSYEFEAQWIDADGGASPEHPASTGLFTTGLTVEVDWRGARWVGAGHGEFRGLLAIPPPKPGDSACAEEVQARAFVSAPGGALLRVNGAVVGTDEIGVAPWLDWTKAMHVRVLDLSAHLRAAARTSNIR